MNGDDETKLMTHVHDQQQFGHQGHTALGEHKDEEVGIAGVVDDVEEQKNVADDVVHSKDTRHDQCVAMAKAFQVRPAERLARQQGRAVGQIFEGVLAGVEDGRKQIVEQLKQEHDAGSHVGDHHQHR